MPKRKDPQEANDGDGDVAMESAADHSGSESEEDIDMVNVDFEMFDPQPAHDFHGLRQLLRQLFDADSSLFDLSALTGLILSQPLLGTTVKTDGNESDPYAFLTVLNLHEHAASKPVVEALCSYILRKAAGAGANPALHAKLRDILDPANAHTQLGLVLTERLINMPVQVVPPMYRMLLEEIEWALEEKEPYNFTHFLVLSKTYTEVASRLDGLEERPAKKGKNVKARKKGEVFYYHPEDEVVRRRVGEENAAGYGFTKEGEAADSKRAFSEMGIKPQGLMMLVEKEEFVKVVGDLEGLFKS